MSFDLALGNNVNRGIKPRIWQKQLINLLRRRLSNANREELDILVHAGPGAGKTLGALLSYKKLKSEGLLNNFLVFCHRNSIANQWEISSKRLGLKVDNLELDEFKKNYPSHLDGWIVTYQSVSKKLNELKLEFNNKITNGLLVIADEAHHLGISENEENNPIWGKSFIELSKGSKIRLGLTGTPFRADNLAFCSAKKILVKIKGEIIEQITPDLCVEPRELISLGDVRPLEFHFQDGFVEHQQQGAPCIEKSLVSGELRESWRARNLRRSIQISDSSCIAIQILLKASQKLSIIRKSHKNAAGLVIARDIEHATNIARLLKENGDSVTLVHSQSKESNKKLQAFEDSESKWLVSVDMCSEGFDAPRLRVIAYLSTVATKTRFIQGITRVVRMSLEREEIEPIPRNSSHVFAPADPLLMEYAKNWAKAQPYLVKGNESKMAIEISSWISKSSQLQIDAISDQAKGLIKIRTAELPNFLK